LRTFCYRTASNCGVPGGNYFILLILTDGIITDMQQTCDAIVNVSAAAAAICCYGEHIFNER